MAEQVIMRGFVYFTLIRILLTSFILQTRGSHWGAPPVHDSQRAIYTQDEGESVVFQWG